MKAVAELIFLGALTVAVWFHGSATDAARFGLTAVVLLGLAVWLQGAGSEVGIDRPSWAAIALLAVGPLQLLLGRTSDPVATLGSTVVLTGAGGAALFWSVRGLRHGPARRAAILILAICVAQALFAAWQWQFQPGRIYGRVVTAGSPFGSFVNHNHFAGLVEMGALLAAGMAVGKWRRHRLDWSFVALGGVAALLVLVLIASRSRGGTLALLAGACSLGVGLIGSRHRLASWVVAGIVAAATVSVAVLPEATGQRLASLLRGGEDASVAYRLDTARSTVRLAMSSPLLGVGLGSFADEVTRFKSGHGDVRVTHAESDVLELLAETGLVGGVILVWLGWDLWRRASANLSAAPGRSGIVLGAFAAIVAMSFHSLFDFNLRIPSNALVFCTLLGLLVAGAPRAPAPATPSKVCSRLLAGAALALALLSGWHAVGAVQLDRARATQDPRQRLARLVGTLSSHPYLAEGYRLRAWTRVRLAHSGPAARRLDQAASDLKTCLRLRPKWARAWADLGQVHSLQGQTAAAESAFERAIKLDPTNVGIGVYRASFLARTGRVELGLRELQRVQEANPGLAAAQADALARRWLPDAAPRRPR
jgi:O-antigen ligase